jgi:hypothetical protein
VPGRGQDTPMTPHDLLPRGSTSVTIEESSATGSSQLGPSAQDRLGLNFPSVSVDVDTSHSPAVERRTANVTTLQQARTSATPSNMQPDSFLCPADSQCSRAPSLPGSLPSDPRTLTPTRRARAYFPRLVRRQCSSGGISTHTHVGEQLATSLCASGCMSMRRNGSLS